MSAAILAAWLTLALLEIALGASTSTGDVRWPPLVWSCVSVALLWSALTPSIAEWNRIVRLRWSAPVMRLLAHIPVVALVALADTAVARAALRAAGLTNLIPFIATLVYYIDLVAVSYVVIILVSEAVDASQALAERRRLAARLESQLTLARLEYLDAQLQPHFLFNALGAVSELAHTAPSAAARMLHQLASLLRFALDTDAGEVTLGRELVAVEPYLDIQRTRFADWLTIVHDIDDRASDCLVPRLVLQPLVENAIRHGLSGRVAAGTIDIAAHVEGNRLVIRISDNGIGLTADRHHSGRGIGLANLRDRLSTLYGDGDRLRLYNDGEGGGRTVAELTVPVRHTVGDPLRARDSDAAIEEGNVARPPTPVASPSPRLRVPAVIIWIGCGLLWAQQSFAYLWLRDRLGSVSVTSIVVDDVGAALVWAALSVLIFALSRRWPMGAGPDLRWPRILAFGLVGFVAAVGQAAIVRPLFHPELALWSADYYSTFVLNFVIYWAIVAIGHRRQLGVWLAERDAAAQRLRAQLSETRTRASRLRADPRVLLSALDRLATVATVDPIRTERILARLADYLRVLLDEDEGSAVDPAALPERELILERLFADLERDRAVS